MFLMTTLMHFNLLYYSLFILHFYDNEIQKNVKIHVIDIYIKTNTYEYQVNIIITQLTIIIFIVTK